MPGARQVGRRFEEATVHMREPPLIAADPVDSWSTHEPARDVPTAWASPASKYEPGGTPRLQERRRQQPATEVRLVTPCRNVVLEHNSEGDERMNELGERLRELRVAAGLSQRELADRVGVGFPHISKVESGKERPSDELLVNVAPHLKVDADELHAGRFDVLEREAHAASSLMPCSSRNGRSSPFSNISLMMSQPPTNSPFT